MKTCITCKEILPFTEFYPHRAMKSGLNKCKNCCKKQAVERHHRLNHDKEWVEKERARGREKYKRLGYLDAHNAYKKPWQHTAIYKGLRKWIERRVGKLDRCIELHHWSYKVENLRCVFFLHIKNHKKLHRHIELDMENLCFREKSTQILLDTREKHEEALNKILEI